MSPRNKSVNHDIFIKSEGFAGIKNIAIYIKQSYVKGWKISESFLYSPPSSGLEESVK